MSPLVTIRRIVVLVAILCTTAAAQPGAGANPSGQRDESVIVWPQNALSVLQELGIKSDQPAENSPG